MLQQDDISRYLVLLWMVFWNTDFRRSSSCEIYAITDLESKIQRTQRCILLLMNVDTKARFVD